MSQHTHTHAHAHAHAGDDVTEANRAYFDEHAHKVEEEHPEARQVGLNSVNAMRTAYPTLFDAEHTEVLDFACGTGLVSQALRPHVKSIIGVDISPASVEIYNKQAANHGFSNMHAVCAELAGEPGELNEAQFDLVACCAAYHHFPSIDATTRVLTSLLKPGGTLLVVDLAAVAGSTELIPPTHHDVVPHTHGLTEDAMRAAFEGAGLTGFEMGEAHRTMTARFGETHWFLARGVKPVQN
ncbi:hypothetical protein VTO73DRAFT_14164 [Trametes versicolor]